MTQTKLLDRLQKSGNPVITNDIATFVWQGETAPQLVGDFNNWGWGQNGESQPAILTELEKGVWTYNLRLPSDAYIEYTFTPDHTEHKLRTPDPLNKRRVPNGLGQHNYYFAMPDYAPTPLARVGKNVPRGKVTRHVLDRLPIGPCEVWLYHPPTDAPVPLIAVWDGRDYLKRGKLTEIVDNLIHQRKIQPVALAMVDNAKAWRIMEYMSGEAAVMMLGHFLLPFAQKELRLLDIEKHPGSYGILGASMGGLMAMYAGLRLPEIFGQVMSQAGAFHYEVRPGQDDLLKYLVKTMTPPPIKIWQDIGTMDWLITSNRQFHALLQKCGFDVTYHEYSAGHNYPAWRNALPQALMTLFGPSKG